MGFSIEGVTTPVRDCDPLAYPFQSLHRGLGALILVTVVVFLPLNRAGLLWDDRDYITDNAAVQDANGLSRIWLEPGACPYYYPATFSFFWLEARFFGKRPEGYHTTSVLLHAANACLAAWVLVRLSVPGALVAGALFALHPIQLSTVGWITEQKNLLATFWYLLAIAAYLKYVRSKGRGVYFLSLLFFASSLLSKPAGCTLPAVLLLLGWWKGGGSSWRRWFVPTLPFFALAAAVSLFTLWWEKSVIRVEGAEYDFSILERILIAGRASWFYLGKFVWPWPLGPLYEKWEIDTEAGWQRLYPALACAGFATLWAGRNRWGKGPLVGMTYYALTLAPFLGFFSFSGMVYAFVFNHHQYMALLGPAALMGAGIAHPRIRGMGSGKAALGILASMLGVCGILTFRQGTFYRSETALWKENVLTTPNSPWPKNYLARALLAEGNSNEALAVVSETLKRYPNQPETHFLMATIQAARGGSNQGIEHLIRAVEIDPNYSNARFQWALALAARGRHSEAVRQFSELLERRPSYWSGYVPYAESLLALGNRAEAAAVLEKALDWRPARPSARRVLGRLLAEEGRFAEAFQRFEEALQDDPARAHRVKPEYAEALTAHGEWLLDRGERDQAIAQFRKALEIWPRTARARDRLEALGG